MMILYYEKLFGLRSLYKIFQRFNKGTAPYSNQNENICRANLRGSDYSLFNLSVTFLALQNLYIYSHIY